jgi:hypothetical protein
MNQLIHLSLSDLRSTFRDPVFKVLLFFPFMSFALIRWGFPEILERFPAVAPYSQGNADVGLPAVGYHVWLHLWFFVSGRKGR